MMNINYKRHLQALCLSLIAILLMACGEKSEDTSSSITNRTQFQTAQVSLSVSSANEYSAQFVADDIASINISINNGTDAIEVLTLTREEPQVSIELLPGNYQLTANLLDELGNILATGTVDLTDLQGGQRYSANIPLTSIPTAVINANLDGITNDNQGRLLLDPTILVDPEFPIALSAQTDSTDIVSFEWSIVEQSTIEGSSAEFNVTDGTSNLVSIGENATINYTPSNDVDLTAGIEDTITVRLTVSNADGESSSSDMTFTILYMMVVPDNELPIADISVISLDSVLGTAQVDGTESYDNDGSIVSYEWEISSQSETITTLSLTGASTVSPTLDWAGEEVGDIELTLTVTDDEGATSSTSFTLTINPVPIAVINTNFGEVVIDEQNRLVLNPVLLLEDELGFQLTPDSTDTSIVSYDWSIVEQSLIADTTVEFNINTGNGNGNVSLVTSGLLAKVNYVYSTAVDLNAGVEDSFTIRLTVTNAYDESSFADVTFVVLYTNNNQAPMAVIQSAIGVETQDGETGIDASASFDGEGNIASYFWEITSTTGTLSGVSINNTDNVSPRILWTQGQIGEIELTLTVTDEDGLSASTTSIIFISQTPTAEYSWYLLSVDLVNDGLPFDATDSTDPGGEALTYSWELSGPDATGFGMDNYGDGTANLFWLTEAEDPKGKEVIVTMTATNESGLSDTYEVEFTIK